MKNWQIIIALSVSLIGCEDRDPLTRAPRATTPECQQISKESAELLERQATESSLAEARQQQEFEQLMADLQRSGASEAQKEIAVRNLTARQDIETAARDSRQENYWTVIRERWRSAGCDRGN